MEEYVNVKKYQETDALHDIWSRQTLEDLRWQLNDALTMFGNIPLLDAIFSIDFELKKYYTR